MKHLEEIGMLVFAAGIACIVFLIILAYICPSLFKDSYILLGLGLLFGGTIIDIVDKTLKESKERKGAWNEGSKSCKKSEKD